MLRKFGLPAHFLGKIVAPGTVLGSLRQSLAERIGLSGVKVVAPPSHDTASAVAGVPAAKLVPSPKSAKPPANPAKSPATNPPRSLLYHVPPIPEISRFGTGMVQLLWLRLPASQLSLDKN
jgi:ribulose kinase